MRCLECKRRFIPTLNRRGPKQQKFCTVLCRGKHHQRQWRRDHPGIHLVYRPPKFTIRDCVICGDHFRPRSNQKACGPECNDAYREAYRATRLRLGIDRERNRQVDEKRRLRPDRVAYKRELDAVIYARARTACDLGLAAWPSGQTRNDHKKAIHLIARAAKEELEI